VLGRESTSMDKEREGGGSGGGGGGAGAVGGKMITTAKAEKVESGRMSALAFGGIMVSSDTMVEVYEKDPAVGDGEADAEGWGTRAHATVAGEAPTYVDELFRMTSARWQQR